MKAKSILKLLLTMSVTTLFAASVFAVSPTLQQIKAKGFVQCGVSQGLPGFSMPDEQGNWSGLDIDMCRALSAAIFGDPDKVKYTPLSAKERFVALTSGEIDVLSRNTTWTLTRDAKLGLTFAGVNYYDGQGFMVRKDSGIKSAMELDGASVCVNTGTTTELNMADFFRSNGFDYEPVVFEKADEVRVAYDSGRCDVHTTDLSGLSAQRLRMKDPSAHRILPETISKEPLGPVVREGDEEWADIVAWTLYAQKEAEEYGLNSGNAGRMRSNPKNPTIKRLLGVEGNTGEHLGLGNDWAYNVISMIGNYGEMYERHVGLNTPLQLQREGSPNALWTKGGLHYPMP
ncbi:MAG: amino acid ABC transporter substrate-binding protein, partial [SAR324 cluster bacterium]|nr:amino acid ABC transporter substrate-binding protein [SAR324 cluster bacterium]